MDEDDDFFDTISVNSSVSRKKSYNGNDYIHLSRNTVYHSLVDFDSMELTPLDDKSQHDKVSRNRDVKTYKQWRDRVFYF